ncbi:MAG: alpha/beta fold hydrolase [Sedimentisphaeraceae bacterium JB056]
MKDKNVNRDYEQPILPDDFHEYWQKGLDELQSIDINLQIQKAEFQTEKVECFDMYFTGTKGARIYSKLLKPRNIEAKAPAVIKFHGLGGDSGDWYEKLGYASEGFVVAAMDCRGQGGKSEDTGNVKGSTILGHITRGLDDNANNLLYRQIYLDAAMLAMIIMNFEYVDANRVGVYGGSQGGALALACASLIEKIKMVAVWFPFLCNIQKVYNMDINSAAYNEIKDFFRKFDKTHEREHEIFTKLGYIDIINLVPNIKVEVLFFASMNDNICPPCTQIAAFDKIKSKKQILKYKDYSHEEIPGCNDLIFQFFSKL